MSKGVDEDKKAAANLLEAVKLDENLYRLGHTKARPFYILGAYRADNRRRFLENRWTNESELDAAAGERLEKS